MSPFPLSGSAWLRDPVTGALSPEMEPATIPPPAAPVETLAPISPPAPPVELTEE